jgi:hypothetical protein
MKKKRNKKPADNIQAGNIIKDCSFYGVKWDEPALEVLHTVAKGLFNLTELFKSQNVTVDSLLKIKE